MFCNLKLTMESGQPPHFLWHRNGDIWRRQIMGERCELWQSGTTVECTPGFERYVDRMLRSSDNLEQICRGIGKDMQMRAAIAEQRGLRLTLSDPWETTVSFVCSVNNNIARIGQMVRAIMQDGVMLPPAEMATANLSKAKLGYREPWLKSIGEQLASYDFADIAKMDYQTAHDWLQQMPGIGPKVADCILLYGFGKTEAFPVDVWMQRAMQNWYGAKTPRQIRAFVENRWGKSAGYAQLYLYNHARHTLIRPRKRR